MSYVRGVKVQMLVDSGSSVFLMDAEFCLSVLALRSCPLKKDCVVACETMNGQMLDTLGTITITLQQGTELWQPVMKPDSLSCWDGTIC